MNNIPLTKAAQEKATHNSVIEKAKKTKKNKKEAQLYEAALYFRDQLSILQGGLNKRFIDETEDRLDIFDKAVLREDNLDVEVLDKKKEKSPKLTEEQRTSILQAAREEYLKNLSEEKNTSKKGEIRMNNIPHTTGR